MICRTKWLRLQTCVRQMWWGAAYCLLLPSVLALPGCRAHEKPLNLVIFTFDTTRADALSCYGNTRVKTPEIDNLARSGIRFENTHTALPITLPSHTSIMTGRYPTRHGVRDNSFFVVPPEEETLAEILKAHGYRTAAAIGAFPVTSRFGISQGFDYFDEDIAPVNEDALGRIRRGKSKLFFDSRRAGRVNEAAANWLDHNHDKPFFLWLHYFDAHHPHNPPPPFNQLYADDAYFGEIAYADSCLGTFLRHLEKLGVRDQTIIVMTADHGEGRGDHNEETHSLLNYESTLHVPLIIAPPGDSSIGRVVEGDTGTVDIMPTVLDFMGIPIPGDLDGRSLRPLMNGKTNDPLPYYAETLSPRLTQDWGELRTLYEGGFKYIHGPRPELFELQNDPDETHNIIGRMPEKAREMKANLQRFLDTHAGKKGSAASEMDTETLARLEALGYVDSGGDRSDIQEILKDGGISPRDRVSDVELWSRAKEALNENRPLEARNAVSSLLAANPENPVYREALATALLKLGEIDPALEEIRRIRSINLRGVQLPSAETLMLAATILANTGRKAEAMGMASQCGQLHPSARAAFLEYSLLKDLQDKEGAQAALERALDIDPGYPQALVSAAVEDAMAGRKEEARKGFLKVISAHPYFAPAHYNLGVLLISEERLQDALGLFNRAVELDPFYLEARYAQIATLLDLHRNEDARRALEVMEMAAPGAPMSESAGKLVREYE